MSVFRGSCPTTLRVQPQPHERQTSVGEENRQHLATLPGRGLVANFAATARRGGQKPKKNLGTSNRPPILGPFDKFHLFSEGKKF